jgi:hypothetical protein
MLRKSKSTFALFTPTISLLKKSGKPLETPDYKQAYLPYEKVPSEREIEAARNQFSTCPDWRTGYTKRIRVLDVPKNLYTYGKEGSSVPISIFKDQEDPIIGPEHTYPGIYELKISLRHNTLAELFEMNDTDSFKSPWQKERLHQELEEKEDLVQKKMQNMRWRNYRTRYGRERVAGPTKNVKGGGGGAAPAAAKKDPDPAKK